MSIPSSRAHSSSVAASGHDGRAAIQAPTKTSPVVPSIVIASPTCQPPTADFDRVLPHRHCRRPDHRRDAPAARDHRSVAGQAAGRGQDAARAGMPWTSSGEVSARTRMTGRPGVCARHGGLGRRDDFAGSDTRRRAEANGQRRSGVTRPAGSARRIGQDARRHDARPPRARAGIRDRRPSRAQRAARPAGCACRCGTGAATTGRRRS